MSIVNDVIRTKRSVIYLGMRLDLRLTLLYQIQYSANKTQKIVGQLSRLIANIGGLVTVRLLYESEIWAETLEVKKRAKSLVSV